MRAVVQRVKEAKVNINGVSVGSIKTGLLVFLGIGENDSEKDCEFLAAKITSLRIFPDDNGLMNLSLLDNAYEALVVSQFTLWGDCRKGRRPSFVAAARPEKALGLYEYFIDQMRRTGIHTETGKFQEMMDVHLINDGPVTMLLDSDKLF